MTWTLAASFAATPAAAATEEYPPLDRPGPALSTPQADLRASLTCTEGVAGARRAPVLLVPATTVTSRENFGWNWMPALRAAGIPYCATDQPGAAGQNMVDMQARAEYLVYAIRRMHELAGRRISIVGHSQGGMIMRWPLRFWPDTRAMVEDVIGMAATNHGSTVVNVMCLPGCAPALWQQRADSDWYRALNSRQETFAGIDYTEIYSRADEFVQPNADDTGSSSLHGPGRITNVALQDLCPADLNEHIFIGTIDATAWAVGLDALTHDGPADERRIDPAVCSQDTMPGVDRETGALDTAEAVGRVVTQLATAPKTEAEPPLRCYALVRGCPAAAATPVLSPPSCRSRRVVTLQVDRLGLRHVRVTVDGRAVRVRHGRAVIDLRGQRARRATVRVTGRRSDGRSVRIVRRFRTCAP
jgi:hypothetical protein